MELQPESTLPSIRLDAGASALDLDPSDAYGAQWDRGKGTPALPLQDEVGPVRNIIEQGESVEADYYERTRSSPMKGMRVSLSNPSITNNIFYVDLGAGQCLSSCSTAFVTLEPCTLEVVGVAGSLPIFGRGTAVFVLTLPDGDAILVRIHNCLYSFGEFNLLSVSQMQTIKSNTLDISLVSPGVRLYGAPAPLDKAVGKAHRKYVDVPFLMDDGLCCLHVDPISSDDPRFQLLQIFDLTPPGEYEPVSQRSDRFCGLSKKNSPICTTSMISNSHQQGRIYSLNGSLDFHSQLSSLSDHFLAPAGLPSARKQYDVSNPSDMSGLSIRFLGGGTDRILHTVSISNGLKHPPSKKHARVPPLNFPQGNMKRFKTPRVNKDNVGHIHQASIAEVLYTDTVETRKFLWIGFRGMGMLSLSVPGLKLVKLSSPLFADILFL